MITDPAKVTGQEQASGTPADAAAQGPLGMYAHWIRIGAIIIILFLGLYVALSPSVVYAPTPRVVLFLLIALLPAILFGAEATSALRLEWPGFLLSTTGAAAVCLGLLWVLNHLAKPEEQIAVYYVVDEKNRPVPLEWK